MDNLLMDFLIMGKIPGTEITVNFEAFLEGLLFGSSAFLVYKYLVYRKKSQNSN